MPQGASYLQAKDAGVGVDEAGRDASVAAVPVDQNQFSFSHLPGLLHNFRKHTALHYLCRMISMKIELHVDPLAWCTLRSRRVFQECGSLI